VQALDACEIGYSADPSLHQRREHLVLLEKEVILIRKELSAFRDVFMVGADQPLGKLLISVQSILHLTDHPCRLHAIDLA
jgi:hypothetical protein